MPDLVLLAWVYKDKLLCQAKVNCVQGITWCTNVAHGSFRVDLAMKIALRVYVSDSSDGLEKL